LNITSLLLDLRRTLASAGVPSPEVDAEQLIGHALGMRRSEIYLSGGRREVTPDERAAVMDLASRRARRVPLQYLLGECEFMSMPFKIKEGVFIPRPETEVLVEVILERCRDRQRPVRRVLDLGTGCGVVGISLARYLSPDFVLSTDVSFNALEIARANAILNRVDTVTRFVMGDGLNPLRGIPAVGFDVVACNPPYVESDEIRGLQPEVRDHEPRAALDGGPDGLRFIAGMLPGLTSILSVGGLAAVEIGAGQGRRVRGLFRKAGLERVAVAKDLAGLDRVVAGEKSTDG
jgi:release factor glutamine methyltransferase